jgi:NAD(P)-dependent dehydrogenase (short-subunit alcohol dehydrogenase family)
MSAHRALVTGAASGIGRAIALGLAREGADVILHDRAGESLAEAQRQVEQLGHRVQTAVVDVTDRESVRAAVARSLQHGAIDVLVNCAGINQVQDPLQVQDDDWDRVLDVNLTGTWTYCQEVGRAMTGRGRGSIVNIASLSGVLASYRRTPYVTSKGAVISLTKSLALDFGERGVRVNAVAPGAIEDSGMAQLSGGLGADAAIAMTPLRRRGTASDVADAVVFLASSEADFVTGNVLMVDGGAAAGTQIGSLWEQ